jgi:hypothetical protein
MYESSALRVTRARSETLCVGAGLIARLAVSPQSTELVASRYSNARPAGKESGAPEKTAKKRSGVYRWSEP